ncbi:MAG: class I SAM-dependent RNA methyltransferase [Desulfuromonadales bacterium]|nr:class I SAM-dependent RNA methyltransferase [Desulfuromonadales bacterium]
MIELTIESLAYGGSGVGRHDGKAIFVPFTAPGDRIRCRVEREKKNYADAELVELLAPAAQRRHPPCPVFGRCGGCQWQHLSYPEQTLWKERLLGEALRRQAGVIDPQVLPLVPAPDEWHYRSRVQFKCRLTPKGFVTGFYRRASHYVIDVAHCPISDQRLNQVLRLFRQWLPPSSAAAQIPQLDLEVGADGTVRAVVHYLGTDPEPLAAYLRPLAESIGLALFLQTGRKSTLTQVTGPSQLVIEVDEPALRLAYGAGGFAQVNLAQNRALVAAVVQAAALTGTELVLDLFCGMGNFSLPLARRAAAVVGVEEYPPAIVQARQNAAANGVAGAEFHATPAEGAASRFGTPHPFDLVVLDPPRTGALAVVKDLLQVRPQRVLYVSCDPATLARDLRPLLHGGYELVWSRPFDLFPQTYHLESLSFLRLITG